jgi:hypothetical protein
MVIDANFKVVLQCRVGNEYINEYLPIIATSFKCNHNIHFIIGGNGPDVKYYIMKYVIKNQKEFENLVALQLSACDKRISIPSSLLPTNLLA